MKRAIKAIKQFYHENFVREIFTGNKRLRVSAAVISNLRSNEALYVESHFIKALRAHYRKNPNPY